MAASLFLPTPPPARVFTPRNEPLVVLETTLRVVADVTGACPCSARGRSLTK